MKLIESEFGKTLYKELLKAYVITFKEFPLNMPKEILQEIKDEAKNCKSQTPKL